MVPADVLGDGRHIVFFEVESSRSDLRTGPVDPADEFMPVEVDEVPPDQAGKAYQAGVKSLCQSLTEARRLISGVRPPILDESGVVAAIDHLIQDYQKTAEGVEIAFQSQIEFDRLAPILENAIYRIAQEG
jgi:signal transduction histidine kinase